MIISVSLAMIFWIINYAVVARKSLVLGNTKLSICVAKR